MKLIADQYWIERRRDWTKRCVKRHKGDCNWNVYHQWFPLLSQYMSVSRCFKDLTLICPLVVRPGNWRLIPAVTRGLCALTHNPLLLCYSESTEEAINPLHTPTSAGSYLHKDIKESGGERRGAVCSSLRLSPGSFPQSWFWTLHVPGVSL